MLPALTSLRRVLVLEHVEAYRDFLEAVLEAHGLEVVESGDVAEALELVQRDAFDLLICDLATGIPDAVAFVRRVRALGLHIPVIVIADEPRLAHSALLALDDCCSSLLSRPIDLDVFTEAIVAADERRHHENCVHRRADPVPRG